MADRTYNIEGREYPSVTTILNVISKPYLMTWAASEERKDILETLGERDLPLGKFAFQRKSQDALDAGSFVHNSVEAYHKEWDSGEDDFVRFIGEYFPMFPLAKDLLSEYFNITHKESITVIQSEQTVWSHEYGYAGTLDLYCKWGDAFGIIDLKTSKVISWEYSLQLAAYKNAMLERGNPCEWRAIIQLNKEKPSKSKFIPIESSMKKDFEAFLAAQTLYNRSKK